MATYNDLIDSTESRLESAKRRKQHYKSEAKLILDKAVQQGRQELSIPEAQRMEQLTAELDKLDDAIQGADSSLSKIRAEAAHDADLDTRSRQTTSHGPAQGRTASFSVGRNERTYSPDVDRTGAGFLADVGKAQCGGDPQAWDRLNRHMQEEDVERGFGFKQERTSAGVGTTAFAGLTVPQYLVDLYAPAVAARRPLADNCTGLQLPPDGMSLNISRVTTASSAALQATELAAVSFTDMDDTLLTIPVQTAAGQQLVSQQAVQRAHVEDLVLNDLMSRVATVLDSTLINQTVTGLSAVAQDTNYTDTTPTAAELYPKILQAASQSEAATLGVSPDLCVMHSRRWYWLSSQMTNTWPLVNSQGLPVQSGGVSMNADYGSGVRGRLPNGLNVVVDNSVPTTLGGGAEDEVYVLPSSEAFLWEPPGSPFFIRADQPSAANLGINFVVFTWFAYTFARYTNAMQKISDTGLSGVTF